MQLSIIWQQMSTHDQTRIVTKLAESTVTQESPLKARQRSPLESDRLEVFHGEANPAVARIYARLTIVDECVDLTSLELTGRLKGPECVFSHTLPLRMPFLTCP